MTSQRYSNVENLLLLGLLDAPEKNETPFTVDPNIFSTRFKKYLAILINKYIESGEAYLARYSIENIVDEHENMQDDWMQIAGSNTSILPISVLNRYYADLMKSYNLKIVKGQM